MQPVPEAEVFIAKYCLDVPEASGYTSGYETIATCVAGDHPGDSVRQVYDPGMAMYPSTSGFFCPTPVTEYLPWVRCFVL